MSNSSNLTPTFPSLTTTSSPLQIGGGAVDDAASDAARSRSSRGSGISVNVLRIRAKAARLKAEAAEAEQALAEAEDVDLDNVSVTSFRAIPNLPGNDALEMATVKSTASANTAPTPMFKYGPVKDTLNTRISSPRLLNPYEKKVIFPIEDERSGNVRSLVKECEMMVSNLHHGTPPFSLAVVDRMVALHNEHLAQTQCREANATEAQSFYEQAFNQLLVDKQVVAEQRDRLILVRNGLAGAANDERAYLWAARDALGIVSEQIASEKIAVSQMAEKLRNAETSLVARNLELGTYESDFKDPRCCQVEGIRNPDTGFASSAFCPAGSS